jgi:excisionase family DNA binding protein
MSTRKHRQPLHIEELVADVIRTELRYLLPLYLNRLNTTRPEPDLGSEHAQKPLQRGFYSRAQVAQHLGISLQMVAKLLKQGKLTRKKIGRRTLIPVSDVAALIGDSVEGERPQP